MSTYCVRRQRGANVEIYVLDLQRRSEYHLEPANAVRYSAPGITERANIVVLRQRIGRRQHTVRATSDLVRHGITYMFPRIPDIQEVGGGTAYRPQVTHHSYEGGNRRESEGCIHSAPAQVETYLRRILSLVSKHLGQRIKLLPRRRIWILSPFLLRSSQRLISGVPFGSWGK